MVKVELPLHSGDARGQFGKKIIFTKNRYARRYFVPRYTNTPGQQAAREAFRSNYVPGLTQEQADLLYSAINHLHDDRYSLLSHVHDHGGLGGLNDDDHPHYFNQERGDARYPLIAHGHNHYVIIKTSDTDRASTTSPTVDPELQISLGTGTYSGRAVLFFLSVNATMDLKVLLTGSDVGGGNVLPVMHAQGAFHGVAVGSAPTSLIEIGNTFTYGSAANNVFGIEFLFRFTKTSTDTFGVWWSQNTSNANILRLERGSMLEIFKA